LPPHDERRTRSLHAEVDRVTVSAENGHEKLATRIELQDTIVIETRAAMSAGGAPTEQFEFECVGIVEDSERARTYAVCYSRGADEFIVTDDVGELLDDESLAQEILTDFLEQADGDDEEDSQ
jgi:hypothetical protein